jgi:hypothetical protein
MGIWKERMNTGMNELIAEVRDVIQKITLETANSLSVPHNEARQKVEQLTSLANNSKYYEENVKEARNKHWSELAILSEDVASKMSVPFAISDRNFSLARGIDKEEDGIHALMSINNQTPFTLAGYVDNGQKADWSLYSHLHTHLKAEDSEWEVKMSRLRDAVINLHGRLYELTLDKVGSQT